MKHEMVTVEAGHRHNKTTEPERRFEKIAIRLCPYGDPEHPHPFRPGCCGATKKLPLEV